MSRKFKNMDECYEYAVQQNKLILEGKATSKRYTIDEFESHLIETIRNKYKKGQ